MLPNNVLKEIVFEVMNLPTPSSVHTGFQCIIVIEGATMLVPARVDGKNIVCDKTTVSILKQSFYLKKVTIFNICCVRLPLPTQ